MLSPHPIRPLHGAQSGGTPPTPPCSQPEGETAAAGQTGRSAGAPPTPHSRPTIWQTGGWAWAQGRARPPLPPRGGVSHLAGGSPSGIPPTPRMRRQLTRGGSQGRGTPLPVPPSGISGDLPDPGKRAPPPPPGVSSTGEWQFAGTVPAPGTPLPRTAIWDIRLICLRLRQAGPSPPSLGGEK